MAAIQEVGSVMTNWILACSLALAAGLPMVQEIATELTLSSLKDDCKVKNNWLGAIPDRPWGAWLNCGTTSILMTHPLNLLGKVDIQTPDQALEYVRFFTSANSFSFFRLNGMVEILPGATNEESEFNTMETDEFKKHFQEASVKDISPGNLRFLPGDDEESVRQGKEYIVTRIVIFPDNRVYRIVETVLQDGWYNIVSKNLLFKDARKVGLDYFP